MFRSRGENLHSVFVLLFLYVAFFLLEHQDPEKFERLFAFDRDAVLGGELWRLVTYQFTQAGTGMMEALSLFITLLLLYMMGSALEEAWGTFHFVVLFLLSSLGSAGVGALFAIPLLGTYFVYFTVLFVYAAAFPHQTFYFFGVIPIRVRVLAFFALAVLLYGVFSGGGANAAALGGAVLAYVYYLSQRVDVPQKIEADGSSVPASRNDATAMRNAARYAAIKKALGAASSSDIDRLVTQCDRDVAANVNICPPADYKPDHVDGYCIRCDGFAECSARYLRLNRTDTAIAQRLVVTDPEAPLSS